MAAICFGAILTGAGGYLVSIKEDQPNYKLQRNFGIFFLVVGILTFLGGLFVAISDYIYDRSLAALSQSPLANISPTNNGGQNAIIPPANNGGRRQYSNANRMQNAQYGRAF
jgi:hypothetical protein